MSPPASSLIAFVWVCSCLSQGQHCPLPYPALLIPPAPQAEAIHPLPASLPAIFCQLFEVSILICLENPLQLFNILKDCLVQCILYNISAVMVSVGHIPWHSESEFLQEKEAHRCVNSGAVA